MTVTSAADHKVGSGQRRTVNHERELSVTRRGHTVSMHLVVVTGPARAGVATTAEKA